MRIRSVVLTIATLFAAILTLSSNSRAGDIKGKVTAQGVKSAADIAVYVDEIAGKKFDAPSQHVTIDQKKITFIPNVTAIQVGTTVDFLNSDTVQHNVYWPSISGNKKLAHNLGTWPTGEKKSFQFNDVGTASLLCNVHPEMSAYVVVVPTSYFAVTDKDGNYVIKNVPAGHYTVKTWSADAKPTTDAVDVTADGATLNITVKK